MGAIHVDDQCVYAGTPVNRYKVDIIIGVVAFLLVAGVAYILYLRFMPGEPTGSNFTPREQKVIDSLAKTQPAFDKTQDSIKTLIIHDTAESSRFEEAARRSQARAERFQARADSLALAAEITQDSASRWKMAYEARTQEAETLRQTVVEKDSALAKEKRAFTRLSVAYANDTLRRIAVEGLNRDLQETVKGLVKPCKIGPLPCPPRKLIAATAFALGKISENRKK